MKYSELVVQEYEYTYSANIQFDLENDSKLARFIPNETTIGLFREFFSDIIKQTPTNHARILYGSYGTGKSHFLTVLSDILGKLHTKSIAFDSFVEKVKDFDKDLVVDMTKFVKSGKPFLIVPIVFDFEDFNRCIYFSLKKVLEKKGIEINFKTFYTDAYNLLEQWLGKEDSLNRLQEVCNKNGTSIQKLKEGLSAFDNTYEYLFKKIFYDMTFGVQFIHEVSNLSENLNEVNKAINERYSGIVFIFDEFGRYLEDNIKKIKVKDIQDMAEYCDHSKYNNHIILISHKEISQYTTRYGELLINEWKKVEGRYKAIPVNERYDQCLSLIKYIIPKNDNWKWFKKRYNEQLNNLYNSAWDFKGFLTSKGQQDNPFEGGYPIHPIALFALDRISKKVAQNERTFFTFLAGKEKNSLYEFLQNSDAEEFHFLGIDKIYDYFEPNLKTIRSSMEYDIYRKLQVSISKSESKLSDNNVCCKVLKTIAAINIIGDYSVLPANKRILLNVIDEEKNNIENAIEWLVNNKVIKFLRHYGYYEFFDSSIFDIDEMISTKINDINDDMVVKTLNSEFIDFVLYPHQYNEEYKVKRVYIPIFTTTEQMSKSSFVKNAPKYYDGILALAIGNKNATKEYVSKISADLDRVIVVVNNNYAELLYEVKKYVIIKYFESISDDLSKEDPAIVNELKYYKEEQIEIIKSIISNWRNIEDDNTYLTCEGEIINHVSNFQELQTLASKKMFEYFPKTLIVNNELINKNSITGVMNSSIKTVIDNILTYEKEEEYFDLKLLSPEYTCLRSVLAKNDIYEDDDIDNINCLSNGTVTTQDVIDVINSKVNIYKNTPGDFFELYDELKKPPFGLRDGYLPMLIAYMLRPYRSSLIIISHGAEQEITGETFVEMVRRPKDFSISISVWDKEKTEFIFSIENIFKSFVNPANKKKNKLKALHEALTTHYRSISKFSRTSELFVSDRAKQYRKLLEKSIQSFSEFFFVDLKAIGGNYSASIEAIKTVKKELEVLPEKVSEYLLKDIEQIFLLKTTEDSIACSLTEKYEKEWALKRDKSYDFYTNTWLDFMNKVNKEMKDNEIILYLSKTFTGFEIDYWNDHHKEEFVEKLTEVKKNLDNYIEKKQLCEKDIKLVLEKSDGIAKTIIFENNELDELSVTLKNRICSTMDNFGQSIKYEDKIKIIMQLLNDLMESK